MTGEAAPQAAIGPTAAAAPPPPLSAWTRRATLPVTLLVQAASAAAVAAPTVAAPRLLEQLALGPTAVGVYIAIVYLGAMVATQVGPVLLRRWGPILGSQASLLMSALGLALLAVPDVRVAALGALLSGLGYGPITPASSQMLARTTRPQHFALVFSIKQTGVPVGGVVAGLMVPPLVTLGDASAAMLASAALCLLAAGCALPLRRALDLDREPGAAWPALARLLEPLRFVLAHPTLRGLALCSFVFSLVQGSLTSFLVSFIHGEQGWSLAAAGAALAAAQTGGVAGRIGWGLICDRWLGPRRTLLTLGSISLACGLAMPLVAALHIDGLLLALLCVFGTTAIGWNGVFLATVARLVPPAQAGQATGGSLFFTFFGAVVGPPLFGLAGSAFGSLAWAFALLALPLTAALRVLLRSRWPL